MTNFNIKIVSDAICPWCYVGKKRLERAIATYQQTVPNGADDTFTISWHPFYLDPSLPPGVSVDRGEHLARKFSLGPERLAASTARLKALGAEEGIAFSLRGRIGNTRDAHRLVQLAKTKSAQAEGRVVATLFKSHFEEDADITSRDALVAVGEAAGLEKGEVESWLDGGKGGEEVDREVEAAYAQGINGVPNFTIDSRYQVQGAQDVETFLDVFARVKKAAGPGNLGVQSTSGLSC